MISQKKTIEVDLDLGDLGEFVATVNYYTDTISEEILWNLEIELSGVTMRVPKDLLDNTKQEEIERLCRNNKHEWLETPEGLDVT